jgi:ATP-dependent Clp protease ATP-binding subunit ClpX
LEQFGLVPEIIGRLRVIASLDALGADDLARVLKAPKDSLIAQIRKLVPFHRADLVFSDAAVREIAKIALERGTGARGLRSVMEEVLEGVPVEAQAGESFMITDVMVGSGEVIKRSLSQSIESGSSHDAVPDSA